MPISMNIPLPKVVYDVEPGGGIVTGMKGANALTQSALQNEISRAQAKYAPYQAYGNAFLTNQQAQWLPYQYQMQAMSNPLLWMAAQNNPALMNQLKTMMTNPMSAIGGGKPLNIPTPGQGGGSTSDGLMSMFMNMLGGNKESSNAMNSQATQTPTNPFAPQAAQGDGNFGANNKATPTEVDAAVQRGQASLGNNANPTIGYQTPSATQAGNVASSGGLGAENPSSAASAQQKGMETTVTGQATNQTDLQKQRSVQLTQQSQIATQALKSLQGFSRNYDKSGLKGQYITPERAENIPALPGETRSAEQLTNKFAGEILNLLTGLGETPAGKSDLGREILASGKPDISLSPPAKRIS